MNQNVEDILIDKSKIVKPKKSKMPIILFILFLMIILGVGGAFAYNYYLNNMVEKPKEKFFRYLLANKYPSTFNVDLYSNLIDRVKEQNNTVSLTMSANTNLKEITDSLNNMDLSRVKLNFKRNSNIIQNKNYNEISLNYSDNELIKLKLIEDEKNIAILSDEIIDRYLGTSKDNLDFTLKRAFGSDIKINESLNSVTKNNKIDITEKDIKSILKEYYNIIYNSFSEEEFSENNNVLIQTEKSEALNVSAYELTTTKSKVYSLISDFIKMIRDDKKLINKIANNEEANVLNNQNEIQNEIINILPIFLGEKLNYSSGEIEDILDDIITEIENMNIDNSEVKISIFVLNDKIIKLSFKSESETIEIDFNDDDTIKITCLLELLNGEDEEGLNNGFTITIKNSTSDVNNKSYIEFEIIENLEINTKLSADITLTGTENSKKISSEAILTYKAKDSSTTININSDIDFDNNFQILSLTDDNCLFLDRISDEDLTNLVAQIKERVDLVLNDKMKTLNLIDQNSNISIVNQKDIQTVKNDEEKKAAKQKLIETVSLKMGEAIVNGETYTIENLKDLQIEGCNVSVNVSDNVAIVIVNGYSFKIDSNFNLTEE